MRHEYPTCIVFMLGYPAMGKRTVGEQLATLLDGVLVDNQLIHRPLLALFRWDGKSDIPGEIWDRAAPIREAVVGTKGSDPEGYRWHRLNTTLFEPPSDVVIHIDTTEVDPRANAEAIYDALVERGFSPRST